VLDLPPDPFASLSPEGPLTCVAEAEGKAKQRNKLKLHPFNSVFDRLPTALVFDSMRFSGVGFNANYLFLLLISADLLN